MEYEFVGYQELDFTTNDGSKINGFNIFVLSVDENVFGRKAEKKFISKTALAKMNLNLLEFVGKTVNIFCDFKGRPVFMQLVK